MSQRSPSDADVGVPSSRDEFNFQHVPAQALDAVRMRFAQLTHSLAKLKDEMSRADLPQWYSLQAQVSVILTQLQSVTTTIHHFEELLDSTVVYPLANFPTTAHEGLLTTLLRKKNIPETDAWINDAKETVGIDLNTTSPEDVNKLLKSDEQVTKWALGFLKEEHSNYAFQGLHTAQELSNSPQLANYDEYRPSTGKNVPKKPFDVDTVLKVVHQGPA
ncbi:LANO_0E08702g1_1 [Lachancea nothofagi CBS 11611]|uniref:Mediator of RNA polymerase II transcription subunit 8 n=1 Tax=Lachancea nothofagi CBS 11611 TaxID=1266666 RepID=A0A1G4JVF7_9SACH|nr:LANO_0E08702g1_1 [Lachancea nothofagi CBS 11611]